MPYFDRFDICAAYAMVERDYNVGGILLERLTNKRLSRSTACQLHRMHYRHGLSGQYSPENAQAIYDLLVTRYNLPKGE